MIESIGREQLPICLSILNRSYENTAVTYGMTEENCPYRGRTRLPLQVFEKEYDEGYLMYGYIHNSQVVGFLSMYHKGNELCIQDIAVLPDCQNSGYGSELFQFAKETAQKLHCSKITLGMVYDNTALRNWYHKLGFKTVDMIHFEKVNYIVGMMELSV